MTGVLALPFHVAITLSGLIVFYPFYFPSARQVVYEGDQRAFFKEAYGTFDRPKLNQPAGMASLDAMVDETGHLWAGEIPRSMVVPHPGDTAAYVQASWANEQHIGGVTDWATFDRPTGRLLHQRQTPPVLTAQHFIAALHLIQFRHWPPRWLYFVLGLAGCVSIASGYLFWLESRRMRHARLGMRGVLLSRG